MSTSITFCGVCRVGKINPYLAFGTPQRDDNISHVWRCCECGTLADRMSLSFLESTKEEFDQFQASAVQNVYGRNFDINSAPEQIEKRESLASYLANLLPIDSRKVCLDYGCGSGLLACALLKNFDEVIATDLDVSLAQEIANFVKADLSFIKLDAIPSNRVNLIVAWHVVEHLPEPYHFFLQCYSLLADKGIIAIQVPLPFPCYFENDHLWFLTIESAEWIKVHFSFDNTSYFVDGSNQFITYLFQK